MRHNESDSQLRKYNIFSYPTEEIMHRINHLHSVSYKSDADGISRRIEPIFKYEDIYLPALPFKGFDAMKHIEDIEMTSDYLSLKRPLQIPCFITHTNSNTHAIIEKGLVHSPLFTGAIGCFCAKASEIRLRLHGHCCTFASSVPCF